jgi:hypothetical protein
MIHEISHGILYHAGQGGKLPTALEEGYAMLVVTRHSPMHGVGDAQWAIKGISLGIERRHISSLKDLCKLTAPQVLKMSRYRSAMFYAQSFLLAAFVDSLSRKSGEKLLAKLLAYEAGFFQEPAMRIAELCGMSLCEFEGSYWEFARDCRNTTKGCTTK